MFCLQNHPKYAPIYLNLPSGNNPAPAKIRIGSMPPATASAFPPAKRRVNPMVQQGDEGLLPFPGKLSSNQKPACRLYALHTGCRRVFVRKQGPQNGCLHPMTERSRAASGVLRLKSRRPAASLIGSGSLRRPQRRSLRGGNPHSAGNHRRRPAFPSPPHAFYSRFRSPHSHIPSRMGIRDFPLSVRLYSTFGGICGYSSRWTSWSASSSFKVVLRVL